MMLVLRSAVAPVHCGPLEYLVGRAITKVSLESCSKLAPRGVAANTSLQKGATVQAWCLNSLGSRISAVMLAGTSGVLLS